MGTLTAIKSNTSMQQFDASIEDRVIDSASEELSLSPPVPPSLARVNLPGTDSQALSCEKLSGMAGRSTSPCDITTSGEFATSAILIKNPDIVRNEYTEEGDLETNASIHANLTPTLGLLALPIDSLHCIASFLTPPEWCNGFSVLSKGANKLSREIIRRVRMHGFKCSTEIVTAFKKGQISDAKELVALYISSGVPIYAKCLGHSYHTMLWRIQVEVASIQASIPTPEDSNLSSEISASESIDPFYHGRLEIRLREGHHKKLTYLEEKCLFWVDKLSSSEKAFPPVRRTENDFTTSSVSRRRDCHDSSMKLHHEQKSVSRFPLPIHQHLLDQHLSGESYVNDLDGKMTTPIVSLAADFFHPVRHHPVVRRNTKECSQKVPGELRIPIEDNFDESSSNEAYPISASLLEMNAMEGNGQPNRSLLLSGPGDDSHDGVLRRHGIVRREGFGDDNRRSFSDDFRRRFADDVRLRFAYSDLEDELFQPFMQPVVSASRLRSVLKAVDLEVYSSSSSQLCSSIEVRKDSCPDVSCQNELKSHLSSRFATYHRRLEAILHQGGTRSAGLFDECLLDFWDEFFPHTASIHYHDTETAVPRISCLHKFLTKPCPQSIGVVQCEIERINVNSKGKGVNMKGRLFPTYEYRLFIRDRQQTGDISSPFEVITSPFEGVEDTTSHVRRDTVLMVAKNRGRKHAEGSGVVSSTKKGANNYYMYMANQMDVDDHFNNVNNIKISNSPARLRPNGVGSDPVLASIDAGTRLLGRLQSNFIGTEFQIFTPRIQKRSKLRERKQNGALGGKVNPSLQEAELDYDSGMSSDTNVNQLSTRKSRFGRLSLRRQQPVTYSSAGCEYNTSSAMSDSSCLSISDLLRPESFCLMERTLSLPNLSAPAQHSRSNRRAIANSSDVQRLRAMSEQFFEEENGVITYTANLLGSRPRIMDVCIPKVSADGSVGVEWKHYLDTCQDLTSDINDHGRMLSCFRQLQQRREPQEHPNIVFQPDEALGNQEDAINTTSISPEPVNLLPEDYGLVSLQNRPPWWNVELGSFVLNFGGRVSVPSVKNFQLCERVDQEKIMLQFGRIQGRHSFTMDFQYPLTAVQAFSIAISSLQSKLSFG